MRTLNLVLGAALISTLGFACGGDDETGSATGNGPGPTTDDCQDNGTCDDASGGETFSPSPYLDIVAVGFELDAVLLADGTLRGYKINGEDQDTLMVMTLADEVFFDVSSEAEQDGHSCILVGGWDGAPRGNLPNINGVTMHHSFEQRVDFYTGNWGHTCTGVLDPAATEWGQDLIGITDTFDQMCLAVGFGPMTEYLTEAWNEDSLLESGDFMFASYIGIDDDSSNPMLAEDWTTGLLFQWDEDTEELVVDDDDLLVGIPVTALPEGSALPQGYVRNFAYWYQDFPLIDFDELQNDCE